MFWAGYGGGKCVKGGIHSSQGFDFVLPHSGARAGSQSNWRFCKNCHVMFFNGYAGGQCVAGGPHVADWLDFSLPYSGFTSATAESGWRFCGSCHTLFQAAVGGGACVAAAGTHSPQGMFTFVLPHADPGEDTPEQQTALVIADTLEKGGRGVWPFVDPKELADSLRQRIRAPSKINQADTMHCGPAAVAYILARYKPALYAQTLAGLYRNGYAYVPGPGFDGRLIASHTLRNVNYIQFFGAIRSPASRPEADWILLSSIRNSESWFNIYWGTGGLSTLGAGWVSAITAPETFENWLRSFGYTKTIRKGDGLNPMDLSLLLEASNLFGNNWRVFLLLHTNVLSEEKQANMSATADHYVTLTSMVKFSRGYVHDPHQDGTDEYIEFDCATWGRTSQHVPVGSTKLLGSDFTKNFYGFVAATN
jgi:hypothetical protein